MMKPTHILFLLLVAWTTPNTALFAQAEDATDVITEDESWDNEEDWIEQEKSDKNDTQENKPPTPAPSYLQEDIHPNNNAEKTWEETRRGLHYSQIEKEKEKENFTPEDTNDSLNTFTGKGYAKALRTILIILGIGLIIGLIAYFLQGGSFRQGKKIKVDISDEQLDWIEENLPDADVQSPLEAAISTKEYRKAIRLYFLLIIQKMTLKGDINWQKEKTNRAYILETAHISYHDQFRSSVQIYERVWYGERTVDDDDFAKISPIFERLIDDLKTTLDHE